MAKARGGFRRSARGEIVYFVRMHEQDLAIAKALIPVAWADGDFADKERQMVEGLLDAFQASEEEKVMLREYAKEKRTLDDINPQDLSEGDRRLLLQHATILTYVDGKQHDLEEKFLVDLAAKLRIPADEAKMITASAAERAQANSKWL